MRFWLHRDGENWLIVIPANAEIQRRWRAKDTGSRVKPGMTGLGVEMSALVIRRISANLPSSSPFKGEVRRGMGSEAAEFPPYPLVCFAFKEYEKL
jgi:hypothetical protein